MTAIFPNGARSLQKCPSSMAADCEYEFHWPDYNAVVSRYYDAKPLRRSKGHAICEQIEAFYHRQERHSVVSVYRLVTFDQMHGAAIQVDSLQSVDSNRSTSKITRASEADVRGRFSMRLGRSKIQIRKYRK